ncbi:MAG: transcriptional regulator [Dehalococcoidia bacterium]|nr:transcriptional regulator [Dehalococcoidia bacterium]
MAGMHPLVEQVRRELQPLERRIREHPYLQAVEKGAVPRDKLRLFVGGQRRIIESDLSSVALMVSRCVTPAGRGFFLQVLQGEDAALAALHPLAAALGLDEAWLRAYEPSLECQAYPHLMAWMALHAAEAEMAGALVINFAAWGANCGRLDAALRARYRLGADATSFFQLFAAPPSPELQEAATTVLEEGLAAGVSGARIRRAARLLQASELMFWDGIQRASTEAGLP